MKAKKSKAADGCDHTFRAIYDHEVEWESDDVRGLLKLPPGVKVKVLNYDPVMKRTDMKLRFPAGYVEPAHTHNSWHSILVTKGRMCVAGKDLRPGDYVFGWDIPHGPYEYPDGCEVFVVDMGDGKGFRKGLRVKGVKGATGIFEMTWGDDGRATFEYGEPVVETEPHVVWRRIGTHAIFKKP